MEEQMSDKSLPRTDSIDELAQFWDTHDLTDFENQLEEVPGTIFDRNATIAVRLQSSEADAVRQIAHAKGLAEADLIRTWVLEKIQSA
jgi:predicted DNA binding CopG/RHH family protein